MRLKTVRGRGGVVEDIRVDNIVMKNIKDQAIVLDMEYAKSSPEPVSERTPQFRNIRLSNITAYTNEAMYINGIEEMPVSEISLHDVVFEAQRGITIKNAKDIQLHNVRVNTTVGSSLKVDNTERLLINSFETAKPLPGASVISLNNVKQALLQNAWPFENTNKYLEITGEHTKNINLQDNLFEDELILVGKEVDTKEIKRN
ncbi:glycosyl hydrolase family 28 protein [Niabella ginsengisoli]|uniref:glycosyl hydrolase family 28 protein n=1 Tax=Niabella ginsengisoli TaxID=522298 RepID=UPI00293F490E|nr:glycosyl hydrolase family 28 protein [Niabella ginsengisoli]